MSIKVPIKNQNKRFLWPLAISVLKYLSISGLTNIIVCLRNVASEMWKNLNIKDKLGHFIYFNYERDKGAEIRRAKKRRVWFKSLFTLKETDSYKINRNINIGKWITKQIKGLCISMDAFISMELSV